VRQAVVTVDLLLVFGLGLSASGCHLCSAEQDTPDVKIGSALRAKANSPAIPAGAKTQTKKDSFGNGPTAVPWTEDLDVLRRRKFGIFV
jgi:hypothetical protein